MIKGHNYLANSSMQFLRRLLSYSSCCRTVVPLNGQGSDDSDLLAHWPLDRDLRDLGPHKLAAQGQGVKFNAQPGAVGLEGSGSTIMVPDNPVMALGTGDFTVALWVDPGKTGSSMGGELLSLFDPATRTGFHLGLRNNTGVTSSQSNTRQLQFGIDAGSEPIWRDEGRPGNATLAFGLTVLNDGLYAGTCEGGRDEAGHVYRYVGSDRWEDMGSPDRANTVAGLVSFRGQLYVGTAKYQLSGSALPESENTNEGGGVFRLVNGEWQDVGRLPNCAAIGGMVVYNDRLYASALYNPAGFFRYEYDGVWTALSTPGFRVVALAVYAGFLWASSYDNAWVARFDGTDWKVLPQIPDNTQTYSFAILNDRLCVGTWPSGRVYRLMDNEQWEDLGQLGEEKEVMGMAVHNGKLYGGTLPLAEIYRYEGARQWTRLRQLDATPDLLYRRAWCMAQFAGRLFCTTLPSGKIFSMETGRMVTLDRELSVGRHHIAAVRRGGRLQLWLDGQTVSESSSFEPQSYNLNCQQPLRIGGGESSSWNAQLSDVRLYKRALSPIEIAALAQV